MKDETGKKSTFVSRQVLAAQAFIDATDEWRGLTLEFTQLDYVNTITEDDLAGANTHLSPADVAAAFGSMTELIAELDKQGRLKTVYQLLP